MTTCSPSIGLPLSGLPYPGKVKGTAATESTVKKCGQGGSARAGLGIVLLLALLPRAWHLAGHGYGNIYYAAAVRSMAESWHEFLFAAFDPGGLLMLDKPPLAFWLQVLSVKLLGDSGLALHLPQLLEGLGSVALVFHLTRKVAGVWAGVLAGVMMALTPAAVAVDRSNLPDSLLLLLLLLAAAMMLRGVERREQWASAAGLALIGVAFAVKMIAAFIVLPAFFLAHLAGCWRGWEQDTAQVRGAEARGSASQTGRPRPQWRRCTAGLVAGCLMMTGLALAWPLFVDLTPPASRPYVGDTGDNSFLTLAFGIFGFRRLAGKSQRLPPPPPPESGERQRLEPLTAQGGRPGPGRLGHRDLAGGVTWMLPFALAGMISTALEARRRRRAGQPRAPTRAADLLWGGWLISYGTAFSLSHSPVHPYYLALLGPPIAYFVARGAVAMEGSARGKVVVKRMTHPRRDHAPKDEDSSPQQHGKSPVPHILSSRHSAAASMGIALALTFTTAWQLRVLAFVPDWAETLAPMLLTGTTAALLLLLGAVLLRSRLSAAAVSRIRRGGLTLGLAALSICPGAWALTPALAPGGRMVPLADPALLAHRGRPEVAKANQRSVRELSAFLHEESKRRCHPPRWLVAAPDVHLLAPLVIEDAMPVMAYGGFSGTDPIFLVDRFAAFARAGEIAFAFVVDGRRMGHMGPAAEDPIANWIRRHGREVPRGQWCRRPPPPPEAVDATSRREHGKMAPWGETEEMIERIFTSPAIHLYDLSPRTLTAGLPSPAVNAETATGPDGPGL